MGTKYLILLPTSLAQDKEMTDYLDKCRIPWKEEKRLVDDKDWWIVEDKVGS